MIFALSVDRKRFAFVPFCFSFLFFYFFLVPASTSSTYIVRLLAYLSDSNIYTYTYIETKMFVPSRGKLNGFEYYIFYFYMFYDIVVEIRHTSLGRMVDAHKINKTNGSMQMRAIRWRCCCLSCCWCCCYVG